MNIRDSVAFITGANRGIGLAFAQELLAAGARKVYGAARNPDPARWSASGASGRDETR